MVYKLTIDSNLMAEDLSVPGMDILKRWKEEGKIDLLEADRPKVEAVQPYGWPGAAPKPPEPQKSKWGGPRARPGKIADSGKANFASIAAVLFPAKDPHKLNMSEINDVAHLIKHHSSKNEIFVTGNSKDFISEGKRERLKSAFGIVAMTPEEAVRMLGELQGWNGTAAAKKKPKTK